MGTEIAAIFSVLASKAELQSTPYILLVFCAAPWSRLVLPSKVDRKCEAFSDTTPRVSSLTERESVDKQDIQAVATTLAVLFS